MLYGKFPCVMTLYALFRRECMTSYKRRLVYETRETCCCMHCTQRRRPLFWFPPLRAWGIERGDTLGVTAKKRRGRRRDEGGWGD